MAEILRTWNCHHCGKTFDAWESNPPCPGCGCVRVSWQPAGGHVGKSAGAIDAEFRNLADCYGLTDLKSGGGAAKPMAPQAKIQPGQPIQFAPGFAAPVSDTAMCVPTGMTVKTATGVGMPLSPNRLATAMRGSTRVEASHRGHPQGGGKP